MTYAILSVETEGTEPVLKAWLQIAKLLTHADYALDTAKTGVGVVANIPTDLLGKYEHQADHAATAAD